LCDCARPRRWRPSRRSSPSRWLLAMRRWARPLKSDRPTAHGAHSRGCAALASLQPFPSGATCQLCASSAPGCAESKVGPAHGGRGRWSTAW
jgi:hypothetical protein